MPRCLDESPSHKRPPRRRPRSARRRQDASLREPWPTGRKNRAPLAALSLRGGQGCRGIRARKISVLGNAVRTGVFRQTAAILRSARFFVRSTRPSLRLAARDVLPPSGEAAVGDRETAGHIAAAGRRTGRAPATDGNRVRKRSGHAAPDSTLALGIAVSRDDSGLSPGRPRGGVRVVSTGAGGYGCHARRPSARGRDVPGARSRRHRVRGVRPGRARPEAALPPSRSWHRS